MMTISKEVYSFQELLEKEKTGAVPSQTVDRVRDKLREWATDHAWYEFVYSTWKEALDQIGFENADISFSGFWCQGDGASFTATIDPEKLLTFLLLDIEPADSIDPIPGSKGKNEEFRPWLRHKIKRSGPLVRNGTARRLRRLQVIQMYLLGQVYRIPMGGCCVHEYTCRTELELDEGGREHRRLGRLVNELEEIVEELRVSLSRAIYRDLEDEYEYRTSDEVLIEDCEANEWYFDLSGRLE